MRGHVRLVQAACALFAAAMICGAADALVTTTYGPFTVNCTSGTELCNNVFSQSVATISNLQVQYTASPGHCSNVRAHILVDGVEKAVTAFLTPGQASGFFDVGPVTPGNHVVALQGEGTIGGCNTGVLANWAGTMSVMTDAVAQAIPATTPLMLLLSSALVIAVTFALTRYVKRRT